MIPPQQIPTYPLCWPDRIKRTPFRTSSAFKTGLPAAIKNVQSSLRLLASDSGKRIEHLSISSNVTLGADKPADPGVAVWFMWDGLQVCIPVDRYERVEHNLQAIHHILEARRVEVRHGGIEIVRASFAGFAALPAPRSDRHWSEVLGIPGTASLAAVKDRFRELAKTAHPDGGGSAEAFNEIRAAFDQAKKEKGAA